MAIGHVAKMNFYAIARREGIPAAFVFPRGETQPLVVRHGGVEVMDGEDRCDPLQDAHGTSFACHVTFGFTPRRSPLGTLCVAALTALDRHVGMKLRTESIARIWDTLWVPETRPCRSCHHPVLVDQPAEAVGAE